MLGVLTIAWVAFFVPPGADQAPPKVVDNRLVIERFAAEPEIVTPTGLTIDAKGRVLVIESHTHFRPENYQGPTSDRIRLLEDTNGDGKADRCSTFFEGTTHTMGLGFHPADPHKLFVATRNEIFLLHDNDGDGRADGPRETLARLETPGNYPHNGLSGFAFDSDGRVYFGLGENLGANYQLVGKDGKTLSGGGEGGNIYRCKPDGTGLERFATGFWNPFHLAFDPFGRLFAVDNDPDSRPPCRLLHVVQDGDYGYRFRNGRKGLHPFTAWNGELPGTLPMVAGTGEAPSGLVVYESDHLPSDYRGDLLATSWGDHRIERFKLKPRGASFEAKAEAIVTGGENFRPVAIATAPDGSIYFSDWVDKSYSVHGKGAVWHLKAKDAPRRTEPDSDLLALGHPDRVIRAKAAARLSNLNVQTVNQLHLPLRTHPDPRARAQALEMLSVNPGEVDKLALRSALSDPNDDIRAMAARLLPKEFATEIARLVDDPSPLVRAEAIRRRRDVKPVSPKQALQWDRFAADPDPFLRLAARVGFEFDPAFFEAKVRDGDAPSRLQALLTLRERGADPDRVLPIALKDPDPQVQFAAIEWIGDEKWTKYRDDLRKNLALNASTRQLFEADLAALERIEGVIRGSKEEWAGESYVAALLTDPKTPPTVLARALRMIRPDHPAITLDRIGKWIETGTGDVPLEAVKTLRESTAPGRFAMLAKIAAEPGSPDRLRVEAVVGLANDASGQRDLLVKLASSASRPIRHEALRALRGVSLDGSEVARITRAGEGDRDPETAELVALLKGPRPGATAKPLDIWLTRLEGPADASTGERVFFSPKGAGCYRCHQFEGRGGKVGPDLTSTATTLTRERLIESIVNPSKEVAPQFVPWLVARKDGTVFTGTLLDESATGEQTYANERGERIVVRSEEVEDRRPQNTSIMPADLHATMTTQEFRDLIGYLRARR